MGGSLSGSKVVRGTVFGRESKGAFPLVHLHANTKLIYTKPSPAYRHDETCKRSKRSSVYMRTLILCGQRGGKALFKNADEINAEEHLATQVRHFLPLFIYFYIFSLFFPKD